MSKISLRYARALLLATSEDTKSLEKAAKNLDIAAEVLSKKRMEEFFRDPQISKNEKEQLIEKALGADPLLSNFLKLVVRNGKTREIKNIAESFRVILSEIAGVATAKIESTIPLKEQQIAELSSALKKLTGKEVTVEVVENTKLLGGMKVFLGDELIDLSLAGKLKKMRKVLS
ncbi:ATP synthase F1 subunit delta [Candidatus Gracilibacteria bacterium]|nr:ATP synthase F1 subunit delta [Candidatus Gracilibacteria bacterium]